MSEDIAGVLLAGGLGRRMGGGDKALVLLAGRPLIAHAAARLAPQVAALILNANGDPARFASLALPVVPDDVPDSPGPLAGVLAALHYFARERPRIRAVVSVSADAPFVPPDLVRRLEDALSASGAPAAVAQSRGQRHHVIGLWSLDAAREIEAALAKGERKAEAMVDRLGAVAVPFPDLDIAGEPVDPFFNVNTPEDLARAEAILTRATPHMGEGKPFVVGVVGWKNSGKTTLITRLVVALTRRGYRVSTVKHTHHDIVGEHEGTDSARHRKAGAQEVAVVSPQRWGILPELRDEPEPPLAAVLARLAPADIVIVEGMKSAPIPKIEVRRIGQGPGPPLAESDPAVFAIAADHEVRGASIPVLALDDVDGLTRVLLAAAGLPAEKRRP